jgi:hypothetical protein
LGPEENLLHSEDLLRRWPDPPLVDLFYHFLDIYQKICAESRSVDRETATHAGYQLLCKWIHGALAGQGKTARTEARSEEEERVRSLTLRLREHHLSDWLQRLASLLAMLMHFAPDTTTESLLVNRRRPRKPFSTYPTSPAAAQLVAETMIPFLFEHEIPPVCRSAREAERYADRALAFQILDPSLESGQLLLGITQAFLQRIHCRHFPGTREARFLERALLEKLCGDCLWGIDRNELALLAFTLLISLLGAEHGIAQLKPQHLFAADALELLPQGGLPLFDGVINNPPWGEELAASERKKLRHRFRSLQHHTDTYISFSEVAIRSLQPNGAFAVVLPSQAVAARNATGLREFLHEQTCIERIILLPRAVFGDATVRGLVLAGRARPSTYTAACQATVYSVIKRMDSTGPPQSFEIPREAFQRLGSGSWSPLLTGSEPTAGSSETVPLGSLAIATSGVQLYGIGRGTPPQTPEIVHLRSFSFATPGPGMTPAVRGRNVQPFRVLNPDEYVRLGRWLARVGDHAAYRLGSRVFVRELCRRDGRLSAALARDGFIPLHGVLTVVPTRVDAHVLVGILNSTKAAEYVRVHAASFSKVDFQRITVGELRQMPVPITALDTSARADLGLCPPSPGELALRSELIAIVEDLSNENERGLEAANLFKRLETVITALFSGVSQACDA